MSNVADSVIPDAPINGHALAEWRTSAAFHWDDRHFQGEEISYLLDEIERLRAEFASVNDGLA